VTTVFQGDPRLPSACRAAEDDRNSDRLIRDGEDHSPTESRPAGYLPLAEEFYDVALKGKVGGFSGLFATESYESHEAMLWLFMTPVSERTTGCALHPSWLMPVPGLALHLVLRYLCIALLFYITTSACNSVASLLR
jgi:hypothetical protein